MTQSGYTLQDLSRHQCKWPLNTPQNGESYEFCGDTVKQQRPYCLMHCKLAYIPPRGR